MRIKRLINTRKMRLTLSLHTWKTTSSRASILFNLWRHISASANIFWLIDSSWSRSALRTNHVQYWQCRLKITFTKSHWSILVKMSMRQSSDRRDISSWKNYLMIPRVLEKATHFLRFKLIENTYCFTDCLQLQLLLRFCCPFVDRT